MRALQQGEAVVIYPEGTITGDPDGWPMLAKTGVARLALMSGAPVVPVAQWGAQDIVGARGTLRLLPRRVIRIRACEPIRVGPLPAGQQPTREQLRTVTDRVMSRIRAEVGELRGTPPPEPVWDPRSGLREAA